MGAWSKEKVTPEKKNPPLLREGGLEGLILFAD